jgi:hypothetical protein
MTAVLTIPKLIMCNFFGMRRCQFIELSFALLQSPKLDKTCLDSFLFVTHSCCTFMLWVYM